MTSKSNKNKENASVLADLNSDSKKSGEKSEDKAGNSVLSKINEDQSEKRSDAD